MQTLNQKNITQIQGMMNTIRNSNNPGAMLQTLLRANPQMKQVMDLINLF